MAKYGLRGRRIGEASHLGQPKSFLRRRGPFAIAGLRNVVPRVERTQTSTAMDNDEESLLLPQEHELYSLRSPPPGATQLEDVTDSLGAALGPDVVPRSRSDVDDEATLDHADSTFWDHFEHDLAVFAAIDDGVHPYGDQSQSLVSNPRLRSSSACVATEGSQCWQEKTAMRRSCLR